MVPFQKCACCKNKNLYSVIENVKLKNILYEKTLRLFHVKSMIVLSVIVKTM